MTTFIPALDFQSGPWALSSVYIAETPPYPSPHTHTQLPPRSPLMPILYTPLLIPGRLPRLLESLRRCLCGFFHFFPGSSRLIGVRARVDSGRGWGQGQSGLGLRLRSRSIRVRVRVRVIIRVTVGVRDRVIITLRVN